jgi:hypothetical protein
MTSQVQTLPDETGTIGVQSAVRGMLPPAKASTSTALVEFATIVHLLSTRELRRPRKRPYTGAELKQIAKKNPPPLEWYEGEDERPF